MKYFIFILVISSIEFCTRLSVDFTWEVRTFLRVRGITKIECRGLDFFPHRTFIAMSRSLPANKDKQ